MKTVQEGDMTPREYNRRNSYSVETDDNGRVVAVAIRNINGVDYEVIECLFSDDWRLGIRSDGTLIVRNADYHKEMLRIISKAVEKRKEAVI